MAKKIKMKPNKGHKTNFKELLDLEEMKSL